jgi:hypothetical protein
MKKIEVVVENGKVAIESDGSVVNVVDVVTENTTSAPEILKNLFPCPDRSISVGTEYFQPNLDGSMTILKNCYISFDIDRNYVPEDSPFKCSMVVGGFCQTLLSVGKGEEVIVTPELPFSVGEVIKFEGDGQGNYLGFRVYGVKYV